MTQLSPEFPTNPKLIASLDAEGVLVNPIDLDREKTEQRLERLNNTADMLNITVERYRVLAMPTICFKDEISRKNQGVPRRRTHLPEQAFVGIFSGYSQLLGEYPENVRRHGALCIKFVEIELLPGGEIMGPSFTMHTPVLAVKRIAPVSV